MRYHFATVNYHIVQRFIETTRRGEILNTRGALLNSSYLLRIFLSPYKSTATCKRVCFSHSPRHTTINISREHCSGILF